MQEQKKNKPSLEKLHLSPGQQILLLVCNYIPFFHVLLIAGVVFYPWAEIPWRIAVGVGVLYLLPPLLAQLVLIFFPIRRSHIPIPSRDYFAWWLLLNLQMIFCRLTFLEEFLRIIPGAYSMWLRLWGARIGGFTYWAAGLRILDRSFLDIGKGVAFGAGVRLNAHVVAEDENGKLELLLAKIKIGDRAMVGGYSLLTSGTEIAPDENTRACIQSSPFSHWKGGKRINKPKIGVQAGREED